MNSYLKNASWLALGLALIAASIFVGPTYPQEQVAIWKAGKIALYGYMGYWISRQFLGRIDHDAHPQDRLARAFVVGMTILAGGL